MAGHSKWANIKHRKGRQDAKRQKIFSKVIREITVAARLGGDNPNDNPRLRAAVANALSVNMPRSTIDNAIVRGAGGGEGANLEEYVYEGYGPGGIAIMVQTLTDNRNRTVAEIRHTFSKYGGSLSTTGSVAYQFERRGVLQFDDDPDEDQIMEVALDAGADDIESDDAQVTVFTDFDSFGQVVDAFKAHELNPAVAEITMWPTTTNECDAELTEKTIRLIDALDDLDDVQDVYTNASFAELAES